MFQLGDQEGVDEFEDARQVVNALSLEYEACEHSDYVRILEPNANVATGSREQ